MVDQASGPDGALVLVADDDEHQRRLLSGWLTSAGYLVRSFGDGSSCVQALDQFLPDAVCLDLHMPGLTGLEALKAIRERHSRLPVVMLTADAKVEHVVEAMKLGAYDYLVKPIDRTKLTTTIRNAVEHGSLTARVAQLETEIEDSGYAGIVGESQQIREVFRQIERVAPSQISVLIHGASGTGKELVARAVHDRSGRAKEPFVALNCAAMPETLQESELFGHEKGAFSGAHSRRTGRFEEADGGTLFLDEVAELSLGLQAKLLRVLQERTFRRLGGSQELSSDFRLLAATHRDLTEEVAAGRFREDLFYRIAVYDLDLPSLSERGRDLELLAEHFLARIAARGTEIRLDADTLAVLRAHSWPGNVRELQNALERASVTARGGIIRPVDLPKHLSGTGTPGTEKESPDRGGRELGADAEKERTLPARSAEATERLSTDSEPLTLAELERRAIESAHRRTGGSRTAMAKQLGIGRTTLYRKLRDYELD